MSVHPFIAFVQCCSDAYSLFDGREPWDVEKQARWEYCFGPIEVTLDNLHACVRATGAEITHRRRL
jgi:hypothetical protein